MYIGIDLGGTNIAAGIVTKDLKIIDQDSRPTLLPRAHSDIVKDMADLCFDLLKRNNLKVSDIESIGIGSPGAIDSVNGIAVFSNNFRWDNYPLPEKLREYINVPITVENDANAAAYGEYLVSGEGTDSFIAITLGTGIGGGIILDKKIYRGFNGAGGEIGHTPLIYGGIDCNCGNSGCWERYASVTALIQQTKDAIKETPSSLMAKAEKVSGRTSFDAAKQGDAAAQKVVDKYIEYVAAGVAGIINMFQPEIIVIGGGISKEGDYLLNPVREYAKKHTYGSHNLPLTKIKIATLMNDAGIIGSALSSVR